MSKIHSPFEFDQSNEQHRKAQHYLKTMDREVFPTFGDVMIAAIVDYFDRYYGNQVDEIEEPEDAGVKAGISLGDPGAVAEVLAGDLAEVMPSPRDDLEEMIERAAERALERKLPEILPDILGDGFKSEQDQDEEKDEEEKEDNSVDLSSVADEISWGFLQG